MNGRCTLAEVIWELLAPDFEPKAAAAKIEQAIRGDDRFPLYCNGEVVKSNITATVAVVLYPEEDGRRIADIENIGSGLGWARRAYNWELEVDAVLALKPQPDTRAESAQATAIAALEKAEAATAETASMRAELEKALAEARTAREQAEVAQARTSPPSIPPAPSAPGSSPPPTEDKPKRRGSREQDAIREWADGKWPDGHQHLELRDIIKVADKDKEFRKKFPGNKFPERTKFARALRRRNDIKN